MNMSIDITACDNEGEVRLEGGQNKYEVNQSYLTVKETTA